VKSRSRAILAGAVILASTPLTASAQVVCGDVLGPGGTFALSANLLCTTDPALTLVFQLDGDQTHDRQEPDARQRA
jgi:hypothetical protein